MGLVRPPAALVHSLVHDTFFEEDAGVNVLEGGGVEEEGEGREEEEVGRDVHWCVRMVSRTT